MSTRRPLLTLGVLLALIGLGDFYHRLYVGRDAGLRAFQSPSIEPLPPTESTEQIRTQVNAWFPGLTGIGSSGPDPADPKSWRFTLQGVAMQKGRPATAFIFAALKDGSAPATTRVPEGQEIHGWTVTRVDHHSATLKHGEDTQALLLFERGKTALAVATAPDLPAGPSVSWAARRPPGAAGGNASAPRSATLGPRMPSGLPKAATQTPPGAPPQEFKKGPAQFSPKG